MKNVVVVHVTNLAHRVANDLHVIEVRFSRDLAANDDDVAFCISLAGNTTMSVVCQAGIEHRIRNRIANFIGMTFTNRLGRKNIATWHDLNSLRGYNVNWISRETRPHCNDLRRYRVDVVQRHIDQS